MFGFCRPFFVPTNVQGVRGLSEVHSIALALPAQFTVIQEQDEASFLLLVEDERQVNRANSLRVYLVYATTGTW